MSNCSINSSTQHLALFIVIIIIIIIIIIHYYARGKLQEASRYCEINVDRVIHGQGLASPCRFISTKYNKTICIDSKCNIKKIAR